MSLFRVYVDGSLFYHPQMSKLAITAAQIQEDAENIDSMMLSAPFNHPYLSAVRPLASTIVCKRGDIVVFEGRALDNGTDFYNTHTWTCESCLAYLKDSVQPPYDYKGTLRGLLELFISVHNNTVEEKKRFVVGNVTVTDNNDYVSYSSIDFTVTLDAIREKLIKTHGGFLRVRYADGVKYLDYIADFDSLSPKTVEYGKNLLDVKISRDHTDRISVLLPLGAKIKDIDAEGHEYETDERVQITSVNGGKNYIVDEDAATEIGMIWKTEIWDNVTVPGNLLTKALARLHDLVQGVTSMELTIVDESDTGADIGDIHAGMYVICKSPPHGIDGRYRCVGRTRDYLNPAGNTITIGASGVTLTGLSNKQNDTISALEEDIVGPSSKIDVISGQVDRINESKMYRTEIVTEGVSIFREKTQRSTVRCKVYSWDNEITDTLPASAFNWHRNSGNTEADADAAHTGMKTITVSTEDVTDELIRNCQFVMDRYTDCSDVDSQLKRLGDELEVVADLTQRWVDENARTAQDQDDFMTKYREYDARYQELQAKVDALEVEKRNRQGRVKRFEVFIQALKKQQGELSDFDDDTWLAVIETVLVRPDGKLVFRFANGLEVEQ